MTAPDKAFEEWCHRELRYESFHSMESAARRAWKAAWLASRKAMAEEAAEVARSKEYVARGGQMIAVAILALIDKDCKNA